MLSGAIPRAWAMPGTAVLRMVVSSACMKKATATSHGSSRRGAAPLAGTSSAALSIRSSIGEGQLAARGAFSARCRRSRCASTQGDSDMCDNDAFDTFVEYQRKTAVSRRQFGALTFGAGLMSLLPKGVGASGLAESDVDIKTPDGTADCY